MSKIAVCSWSLRPTSPAELVDRVRACSIGAVQLALDPIGDGAWDELETRLGLERPEFRSSRE